MFYFIKMMGDGGPRHGWSVHVANMQLKDNVWPACTVSPLGPFSV